MATRIRLQRKGRKGKPIYSLVIADQRSPRDGKFIEKVGTYNPNTNPATINIDFDKCVDWVMKGASPTDTCRAILSYKGVMLKKHLLVGVSKGAITEEQANKKFEDWIKEKENKINVKKDNLDKAKKEEDKEKMEAESEKREKRKKEIEDKLATEEASTEEAPAAEETPASEEAPAAEESPASEEAPAAEESPAEDEVEPSKEKS